MSLVVKLKTGRDKPIARGHPLVFSGAVAGVEGESGRCGVADVVSAGGTWLARGLYHPSSAVSVRIFTRDPAEPVDAALFGRRVDAALAFRDVLFGSPGAAQDTNAYRLIYSESDGLSGLIADRYADVLSVQVEAAALVPYLGGVVERLSHLPWVRRVFVTADPEAAAREGLDGSALPPSPPLERPVAIRENGLAFEVAPGEGQKTGYFLDQRVNRQRVAAYAKGRRVLSGYCYTGSFEVYAAAAGAASILGIDRSEEALRMARRHHELNGTTVPVDYRKADVPETLRKLRDAGQVFDLVILDPPRFVANRKQVEKGLRAYKDINLHAMKLLAPGGILASFSCSGQVSPEDFRTMIGWASVDVGRRVRVLETLGQPADHPVLAVFPESSYLKGVICTVD